MLRFHTKCTFYPLGRGGGGGGGGNKKNLQGGGPPPGGTPVTLLPFFTKKVTPLVYHLLTNATPSTNLVYNFVSLLTAVNELSFKKESHTQIERFLD